MSSIFNKINSSYPRIVGISSHYPNYFFEAAPKNAGLISPHHAMRVEANLATLRL
ncbi:hypothetical protein [Candidatus Vallotia lariciata]|uniref:hypothetical protein n=1 Tax=Candidatus Vallotia laricis TaxID=2018052 RepID=UPI001D01298C|nr:hypothetical protein [Candidatus Vallotia lariciata]UDG83199.1 hypothetical protein GKR41_00589 [Candidatus Vallotia lariciata]